MRHNVKTYLLIVICLLVSGSLALLQSCKRRGDDDQNCENSPPKYYSLSAAQKAILPYTGYDTISMVSNMGDTIHCIGTGKQKFNTKVFERYSNPACMGGTEKFYEAYKIVLIDHIDTIEMTHYYFYPGKINKGESIVSINFKEKSWTIPDVLISHTQTQSYIGNVNIGGIEYSAVNKVLTADSDTTSFLLLNKTNGIIKLQLTTAKSWELIKN